ncbi:MAG: prepilin-type N-terminal cleavage/methylation domain-containing protein [Candidatus Gracilibacteria bacterium]|nr:prepilin-type N-terminal cleavage/methylation domain-containing protein [Candidatus Gracilibacteria bacterium]
MNKQQIKAFTLVELIIVITILTILATIGFMSYQSYTADARDSSRVTSVREISNGLEISFTKNSKYPMPDSPILTGSINGYTYSYKGFVGDSVSKNLKLSDTKDPLSKSYYVYAVDVNQSAFQLATVLENNLVSKNNFINNTYAAGIPTAKVSGNYKGVIKFSSGASNQETWIANIPSLIWNNTGSISLLSTNTRYVVNNKSNLPYDLNNGTDIGSKDANSIIKEVTGATGTSIIGVNITDIINGTKTISEIFTGTTLDSFNTFGNSSSSSQTIISNLEKSIIGNTSSPVVEQTKTLTYSILDPLKKGAGITIAGDNLTATNADAWQSVVLSKTEVSSGKWYWETEWVSGGSAIIGITPPGGYNYNSDWPGLHVGYSYDYGGIIHSKGTNTKTGLSTFTTGVIIGIALDLDNNTIQFFKDGVNQGGVISIENNTYSATFGDGGSSAALTVKFNFGQNTFAHPENIPTGFNKGLGTLN